MSAGAIVQPTRQPVTLKVFDRLPIVIVRSRIASIDAIITCVASPYRMWS